MNVFVRKKISAFISFPWIMNRDFSIEASSHRWVYSVIAVVISDACFLAMSTSLDCFDVRLSFLSPLLTFALAVSLFVFAISFRLLRNLGGNFPCLISLLSNSFMVASSDFVFSKAPSIPKTSLCVSSIDFSWTRFSICSLNSWIRWM